MVYRPARPSVSWEKRVVYRSKGGKQNKRDSGLAGIPTEELIKMRDKASNTEGRKLNNE
ncbi:hypothetical protein [Thermoflavimicrobium daqui]|uniref:hypothetical protein n=1 Tax=Thermoflavimicrobium daqui TaxID=2137476 RepID=UPI00143D78FA|nr:hypothetical protein [Thermoflavimicrobium daqui]